MEHVQQNVHAISTLNYHGKEYVLHEVGDVCIRLYPLFVWLGCHVWGSSWAHFHDKIVLQNKKKKKEK